MNQEGRFSKWCKIIMRKRRWWSYILVWILQGCLRPKCRCIKWYAKWYLNYGFCNWNKGVFFVYMLLFDVKIIRHVILNEMVTTIYFKMISPVIQSNHKNMMDNHKSYRRIDKSHSKPFFTLIIQTNGI